ncbi:LamG-like jellyroll fold domain-containing protein, partial [Marinoscillum furvescens]|uniref:LamG-like jellyroll fold domain-containing protein n=1 Tax=Marinoscillum furvescens TaxID=1026 RepID=UPI001C88789E
MKSFRGRVLLLIITVMTPLLSFGQENCADGIDNDGDGLVDCYDSECYNSTSCDDHYVGNSVVCFEEPSTAPAFAMVEQWSSADQTADSYGTPMVADLDDNGIPEVITINHLNQRLWVLDGATGAEVWNQPTENTSGTNFTPHYNPAVGNVDDSECAWIFVTAESGTQISAYNCEGVLQWSSNATQSGLGTPGLADFDQDGTPEVYYRDEIKNALDGTTLVAGGGDWEDDIAYGALAIDVLPDSDCADCAGLELVTGKNIYAVNLSAGTLTSQRNISTDYGSTIDFVVYYGNQRATISAADYNLDGNLDIMLPAERSNKTAVYFWDVANSSVSEYRPSNDWHWGAGRINIADIDNDGLMNAVFVSGKKLWALDENWNRIWDIDIQEQSSGFTGCTLFDFNGDGASEIIYRSEYTLIVIDGNGNQNTAQSKTCRSRTAGEYPVVADVDGDGASEICVSCFFDDSDSPNTWTNTRYSHVRVFEADGEVWQPSRSVWNQHAYFNVNVNDNLTIPQVQQDHTRIFGTVDCNTGTAKDIRPLNGFLNQSTIIDSTGCPSYVSPDINFAGNMSATASVCPQAGFEVTFDISNTGDTDIAGTLPVTFYDGDPRVAGSTKLNTVNHSLSNLEVGETRTITLDVEGSGGAFDLYVSVNDYGGTPPITEGANAGIVECESGNNIGNIPVDYTPFSLTLNKLADNTKCDDAKPNNGAAEAYFEGTIPAGTETIWLEDFGDLSYGDKSDNSGDSQWTSTHTSGYTPDFYGVGTHWSDNAFEGDDTGSYWERGPVTWTSESIDISGFSNVTLSADLLSTSNCDYSSSSYRDRIYFTYILDGTELVFADEYGAFEYLSPSLNIGTGSTLVLKATIITSGNDEIMGIDNIRVTGDTPEVTQKFTEADGYQYDWYEGTDFSTVVHSGMEYNTMAEGTYSVVGYNIAANCYSDTLDVTINRNDQPQFLVGIYQIQGQTNCVNPDGILTAFAYTDTLANGDPADTLTTGYSFNWYIGSDLLSVIGTGDTLDQLEGGGYTVIVEETVSGCTNSSTGNVDPPLVVPPAPDVAVTNITSCGGTGSASATVGGSTTGYDFEWYIGESIKPTADFTTSTVTGLSTGYYIVRAISQSTSCNSDTTKIQIVDNSTQPTPVASQFAENSSCDTFTGVAVADGDGAGTTSGYTFEWFSGNNTAAENRLPGAIAGSSLSDGDSRASGLPAGIYTVRVTKDGCTDTDTVLITNNYSEPEFNASTPVDTDESIVMDRDAYVSLPQLFGTGNPITGAVTISYWANFSTTNYNNDERTFSSGATGEDQVLLWSDNHNGLAFVLRTDDNSRGRINSGYSATGWAFVTGTWDAATGEMKLYVNAVEIGSTTHVGSGVIKDTGNNMYLGRDNASSKKFGGELDEVRFYDRALSQSEIFQSMCGELTGTEAGLVAYYDFNNIASTTTGTTVPDITGNGHDGSLQQDGANISFQTATITCPVAGVTNNTSCDASNPNGTIDLTGLITPAGSYTYTLYEGFSTSTQLAQNTSGVFSSLDQGFYTVTAEDGTTSCITTPATLSVGTAEDLPAIVTTPTSDAGCDGTGSGQIAVTSSSSGAEPTGGYTYRIYDGWNSTTQIGSDVTVTDGSVGHTFTGLEDGQYRIEVINNDLTCSSYYDEEVDDNSSIPTVSSVTTRNNNYCVGANGSISAQMPDANSNYTFTWYYGSIVETDSLISGETGSTLNGIDEGQYTFVATRNATNCTSAPITRSIKDSVIAISVTIREQQPQSGCGAGAGADGIAEAGVDDGLGGLTTSGHTFEWSDVSDFSNILTSTETASISELSGLEGDNTYYLRVTDDNSGCTIERSVTISKSSIVPILTVNSKTANTGCNASSYDGSAIIDLEFDGSNVSSPSGAGYSFEWYYSSGVQVTDGGTISGSSTESISGLIDGTYKVVSTAPNGCTSDTLSVTIDLNENKPAATASEDEPTTGCNIGNGRAIADGDGAGTTSGYTFEWFMGNNNTNESDTLPGPANSNAFLVNDEPYHLGGLDYGYYTVRVTSDANGCSELVSVYINDDKEDPLQIDTTKIVISAATSCDPSNPGGSVDVSDILANPQTVEINNINGSFENPHITTATNHQQSFNGGRIKTFDQSDISGWSTTASDDRIEIWHSSNTARNHPAYEGDQWAEINANQTAALYFDLNTQPGVEMIWRFAHRGRSGVDSLGLYIGPSGGTLSEITRVGTDNSGWELYEGTYTVPTGQYFTRFEYRAISTATGSTSVGNFIDGVEFYMDPYTYEGYLTGASGAIEINAAGVFDSLAAGSYSFYVTDNYTGCTSDLVNIEVADSTSSPQFEVDGTGTQNNAVCDVNIAGAYSGQITVARQDGNTDLSNFTFAWYDGTGTSGPTNYDDSTPGVYRNLPGGSYTVVVEDQTTKCDTTFTYTILDEYTNTINNFDLTGDLDATDDTSCNSDNGTITLTAAGITALNAAGGLGDYNVKYYIGTSVLTTATDSVDVTSAGPETFATALASDDYTVVVVDNSSGCATQPYTVFIDEVPAKPEFEPATIASGDTRNNSVCDENLADGSFNGQITVNLTGAGAITDYSYAWFDGNSTSAPATAYTVNNNVLSEVPGGTYTVQITNTAGNGCDTTITVSITDAINTTFTSFDLDGDITASDDTSCNSDNGTITLTAAGITALNAAGGLGDYNVKYYIGTSVLTTATDSVDVTSAGPETFATALASDDYTVVV